MEIHRTHTRPVELEVPARRTRRPSCRQGVAVLAIAGVATFVAASVALVPRGAEPGRAPVRERGSDPTGVERAIEWIDGLESGRILPGDLTSRLSAHDRRLARAVRGGYLEVDGIRSESARRTAVAWLNGLANGSILTNDVARLGVTRPGLWRAVRAAWADVSTSLDPTELARALRAE